LRFFGQLGFASDASFDARQLLVGPLQDCRFINQIFGGTEMRKRLRRASSFHAVLVVAVVGSLCFAATALATPCVGAGNHCYALAEWETPTYLLAGLNLEFQTPYAEVAPPTEGVESTFMTNEAWLSEFAGREGQRDWVEAGVLDGAGGSVEGPTLPYWQGGLSWFTAEAYGGKYLEQDYPGTGPGNNLWDLDIHYVPSDGLYHVITSSGGLGAWGGQPSSAGLAQAGLEEDTLNVTNWGTTYNMSWWSAQNGVGYSGWVWEKTHAKKHKVGKTCADLRSNFEFYWQANAGPC
jgi:hypothetical protein